MNTLFCALSMSTKTALKLMQIGVLSPLIWDIESRSVLRLNNNVGLGFTYLKSNLTFDLLFKVN